MLKPFLGLLFVAIVATAGDYTWYELGARNRATAGSIHGAALLGAVGLVLGWLSGRIAAGLLTGVAAGVGGALAYYAMTAAFGGRGINVQAMVAAWAAVWIVLAICNGRLLRRPPDGWGVTLARGVAAAVLGGVAFYLMLDPLWGQDPRDGSAILRVANWLVAWAPGVLALTYRVELAVRVANHDTPGGDRR